VVDVRRDEIPVSILAGRGDRLPVVRIQHGGRSVDTTQTNDPLGRQFVTITGLGGSDGTQFVVGGVPVRLVTFSITSNFTAPLVDDRGSTPYTGPAIRYQTFAPALFGSDQFPADISGMAGAIATIPTVTNATFPGSLEGIVFRPTTNSNPLNPISSDPVIRGNEASLAGDGSSIVNPVITSVTEQSLQRQPQKPACEGILATTSTTPPETRSPFSVTNPCSSLSDEAQILRILREDGN
jgi:hypothetical protein